MGLTSYTIIDPAHVNAVQSYYLLRAAPEARAVLHGEDPQADAELTIWPNRALPELPKAEFDLILNQDSLPEMSPSTVNAYLRWIRQVCRGTL